MNRAWVYRSIGLVFIVGGSFAAAYGPTNGLPAWGGLIVLFAGCLIPSFPQLQATAQPRRTRLLLAEGCAFVLAVCSLFLPTVFVWPCVGGLCFIFLYSWWVQRKTNPRVKREGA